MFQELGDIMCQNHSKPNSDVVLLLILSEGLLQGICLVFQRPALRP